MSDREMMFQQAAIYWFGRSHRRPQEIVAIQANEVSLDVLINVD